MPERVSMYAMVRSVRRVIFSRFPAEAVSTWSLMIVLLSGVLWNQSSFVSAVLVWLVFVWWQRLLASGGLTFTIVPWWKSILNIACGDFSLARSNKLLETVSSTSP